MRYELVDMKCYLLYVETRNVYIKAQNRVLHNNLANNNLSSINQTSALMWVIRKPLIEKKNHCLVSKNIFVLHFCYFYFFSVVNKPHLKKDILSKCYFYEVHIGIFINK